MNAARDAILASIRRSLRRRAALGPSIQRMLDERIARHEPHMSPKIGNDPLEQFVTKLQGVAGSVSKVSRLEDVPKAVTQYLSSQSLPLEVVMANDPALADLSWPQALRVERRVAHREDRTSVTGAFAGIAETGTLVLLSDPQSPTTLNFLPDVHVVVLRRGQIAPHIEDVWQRLRDEPGTMPRTVNFITGPSRTADIEQTIQLGAHGPRNLHVIICGE
jgi:L-lactate dehydrogenase complex protein LldG